jgi:broad specificity phosphatase PhoE
MKAEHLLALSRAAGSKAHGGTTVYLARHGESQMNHQSMVTGQLDPALSLVGQAQAEALAQCLAEAPLEAVYASALQRARQTAQPLAARRGLPVAALPAFNEIHLGVLQGRHRDERDPEAQALWARWHEDPWRYRVPGGESFAELIERTALALADLLERHRGQHLLIVGHRVTNRVILGILAGWPRERWSEIRLRHKYAYRLRLGPDLAIDSYVLSGGKTGRLLDGFVM